MTTHINGIPYDQFIKDLAEEYESGESMSALGRKYGIRDYNIRIMLRKAGMTIRKGKRSNA